MENPLMASGMRPARSVSMPPSTCAGVPPTRHKSARTSTGSGCSVTPNSLASFLTAKRRGIERTITLNEKVLAEIVVGLRDRQAPGLRLLDLPP